MANSEDSDQKPTDLDLHCLQRQDISGFSRTRVKRFGLAYFITSFAEMLMFNSNSVDPYQILQNVASEMGLHGSPKSHFSNTRQ